MSQEPNDLFETPELIPANILGILDSYPDELDYTQCRDLEIELNSHGYSIEWGLSSEPFNLQCIDPTSPSEST